MSWPTPAAVLQAPSKAAAPDSRNKLRTRIAKVLRIGSSIGFDCVLRNVGRAKEKLQDRKLLTRTFHRCNNVPLPRGSQSRDGEVMFEDRALSSFERWQVRDLADHLDGLGSGIGPAPSRSNLSPRPTVSNARSSMRTRRGKRPSDPPLCRPGNRPRGPGIRNSGDSAKPKALVEPLNSGARAGMVIELGASVYSVRKSEF